MERDDTLDALLAPYFAAARAERQSVRPALTLRILENAAAWQAHHGRAERTRWLARARQQMLRFRVSPVGGLVAGSALAAMLLGLPSVETIPTVSDWNEVSIYELMFWDAEDPVLTYLASIED